MHLKKDWNSPIYAFYHPVPDVGYHKGRYYHEFKCTTMSCKKGVHHYLDKKDVKSTSNMQKHVKLCWAKTKNANEARTIISRAIDGSITASFECKGKGKVTYSHQQHTRTEMNFAMDTWTSPNHKAFVAVSVHLEHDGEPLAMILDIIEVAEVQSTLHT
ncbi:hypothetical protein DFH29DRAFT_985933 [Suillus ampliporus]|nr:hypothetical protein DFH29DRAFT_985933 [Suillus ampliporus]